MADDLSVAMERLRTSTQRLNKICDDAAQTVRDTEAFLEEMQIGIKTYIPIEKIYDNDTEELVQSVNFGYDKYTNGKFRFTISHVNEWTGNTNDMSVTAWSEASRELKLQSYEKLPELLIEIAKNVDDRVAKAERVVTEVTAQLTLPKKRKVGDK